MSGSLSISAFVLEDSWPYQTICHDAVFPSGLKISVTRVKRTVGADIERWHGSIMGSLI